MRDKDRDREKKKRYKRQFDLTGETITAVNDAARVLLTAVQPYRLSLLGKELDHALTVY